MGIDGGLSIIGLHEPVFRFHNPTFGISEILLCLGGRLGGWCRGGLARLLSTLGLSLLLGFSLDFGFGRRGRLGFLFRLRLCAANFFRPSFLVGDPVRHLLALLVRTVKLVFLAVGCLSSSEPLGDLGFELRRASLHPLVGHRLVLGALIFVPSNAT